MNNLLRTLSESQVKTLPNVDLKLLLTTVKEGRGRKDHDSKLADPFYDSLEGLLVDLRTVTIDNHDAEPFLKPVLKAEAVDYYDVISNPMDLGTMLKKVKQRQYKSKKDFKDDLDLIWNNCLSYNANENHPIRKCALRLKVKAEKLLQSITDRKERTDPSIPPDFAPSGLHIKLNGVNGRAHTRSPSIASVSSRPSIATFKSSSSLGKSARAPRRGVAFEDSPALIRTPEGMASFREIDRSLEAGPSSLVASRLRDLVPVESEDDLYENELANSGDKRKVNGINDHRPHKRARFNTPLPIYDSPTSPSSCSPTTSEDDLTQLWWASVHSDALLANGLPEIPYASSSSSSPHKHENLKPPIAGSIPQTAKKKKRLKKLPDSYRPQDKPKALLTLMNNNIRTIKRVRHTHAKFAALGLTKDSGGANEDGDGPDTAFAPASAAVGGGAGLGAIAVPMDVEEAIDDRVDERPWEIPGKAGHKASGTEIGSRNADECLRWMNGKVLEHAGFQGTSGAALDVLTGVASDYLLNVGRTIKFLGDKFHNIMSPEEIILHTLFESGISKIQDLERYVADDVERYGSRLADLEKKLVGAYREVAAVENLEDEGLFDEEEEDETSALALGEFADTLGVDYFGLRELGIADEFGMSSLTIPKRLLKGKKRRENALPIAKPTEPPPPFPPPPPLLPLTAGQISEQIGLLQPFYQNRLQGSLPPAPPAPAPLPTIPPLAPPPLPGPSLGNPYIIPPLPNPTIPPLPGPPSTSSSSAVPMAGVLPPMPNIPPTYGQQPPPPVQQQPPVPPPDTVIPDDSPTPAQLKMGPLGQIVKTGSSYPAAKKKAKAAAAAAVAAAASGHTASTSQPPSARPSSAGGASVNGIGVNGVKPGPSSLSALTANTSPLLKMDSPPPVGSAPPGPKKKKGATGVGSGNGRKKKMLEAAQAQAQAQAHPHAQNQGPGSGHGQQDPRPPPFPPVVAASA